MKEILGNKSKEVRENKRIKVGAPIPAYEKFHKKKREWGREETMKAIKLSRRKGPELEQRKGGKKDKSYHQEI